MVDNENHRLLHDGQRSFFETVTIGIDIIKHYCES